MPPPSFISYSTLRSRTAAGLVKSRQGQGLSLGQIGSARCRAYLLDWEEVGAHAYERQRTGESLTLTLPRLPGAH